MKKLIASTALGIALLSASPAFAYEVKSGDTMSGIAQQHGMSLAELSALNPQVKDINIIYVGEQIRTEKGAATTFETNNETVKQDAPVTSQVEKAVPTSNGYEVDLLARLVRAEAGNQSFEGKVAVAQVVLNRVASPLFPNSISGVIYQSGQFSPVSNGSINRPPTAVDVQAVHEAMSRGTGKALFFYNPATASSRWLDSRPTVNVIGDHVFKQ